MEKQVYSLFELNQYVKQVLTLNFEVPIWIEAEISQVSHSRNNIYIDLIEQQGEKGEIIAQARATMWFNSQRIIKKKYGELFDDIIQDGQSIKIMVVVEFHERYGYSLNIQDLDAHYTIGKIAVDREKTIGSLRKRGLIDKNAEISLKKVLQRIAILSSETAAGYHDFNTSINENDYDYAYTCSLFTIALQGKAVKNEVLHALNKIYEKSKEYDCIVIIRGGGSKVDLSAFDDIEIATAIAKSSLPVFTGIGHDIDISVADVVAHRHFKTPTAVAEYLIQYNRSFEEEIYEMAYYLESGTKQLLFTNKLNIRKLGERIIRIVHKASNQLEVVNKQTKEKTKSIVKEHNNNIILKEKLLNVLDPMNVMKRGFSITYSKNDKKVLRSTDMLDKGDIIISKLYQGEIESTVN